MIEQLVALPDASSHMEVASLWGLRFFLAVACSLALRHVSSLFLQRHGWTHRLLGALHLTWIILGAYWVRVLPSNSMPHPKSFFFDLVLGCLGILVTLSAAKSFPHRHVRNAQGQSGTLSERAVVTQSEMVEHSFYQGLNLCQAIYLHGMAEFGEQWSTDRRLFALFLVSSPWFFRKLFPVHSFSSNWKKTKEHSWTEVLLYRIKKYQYMFYKHAILHGINVSVALNPHHEGIPHTTSWRIFWLALNLSYVMEFFLQTMVKRKVLLQEDMLWLQRLLMLASSLAAIAAMFGVLRIDVFIASLLLNLVHCHHDVFNTMFVCGVAMMSAQP